MHIVVTNRRWRPRCLTLVISRRRRRCLSWWWRCLSWRWCLWTVWLSAFLRPFQALRLHVCNEEIDDLIICQLEKQIKLTNWSERKLPEGKPRDLIGDTIWRTYDAIRKEANAKFANKNANDGNYNVWSQADCREGLKLATCNECVFKMISNSDRHGIWKKCHHSIKAEIKNENCSLSYTSSLNELTNVVFLLEPLEGQIYTHLLEKQNSFDFDMFV